MGYIFTNGVWRHMSEVHEEESDSEGEGQLINRDQSRDSTQHT